MQLQVICLGECLIDRIFDRYAKQPFDHSFWNDYPGGAPANVAMGLVKLGTSAGFIGSIGRDTPGQGLISSLTTAGVDCSQIQIHPTAPTRVVLVQRNEQGDRNFVGFSKSPTDSYADTLLQPDQLPADWFAQASYLVMGTLGLAYSVTRRSMKQALQWAQTNQTIIVVDVNWRSAFWPDPQLAPEHIKELIHQADIVKFSQEEADWLFQTTDARKIFNRLDRARAIIVTAGANGCWYATKTIQGKVPAFVVDSEDTTGAGDAFLAGFIHRLRQDGLECLEDANRLHSIVRYASATGALTTLRPGAMTAQPQAEEVDAFLYLQPSLEPDQ
jgi:fructokinase